MSRCYAGLLAVLLGLAPLAHTVSLSAQQPPRLQPGQRVRVTMATAGATPEVWMLSAVARDTIVLSRVFRTWHLSTGWVVDTMRTAVPVTAMSSLDVSMGRGHSVGRGFLIGAAAGALIAGTVAAAATPRERGMTTESVFPTCTRKQAFAAGALAGGLVCGGVGALVGSFFRWDRWEPAPLERLHELQISVMHGPAGRLADSLPPQAARAPTPLCSHAQPRAECSAFLLTNFGGYVTLGADPLNDTPLRVVADLGVMLNTSSRDALGATVVASLDRLGFALGPALRYRRWLSSSGSVDIAVGTPLTATTSNIQPGSVLGLVKWNANGWFGWAARPELVRRLIFTCGLNVCTWEQATRVRVSLGAELGQTPGVVVAALATGVTLVLAAIIAGAGT